MATLELTEDQVLTLKAAWEFFVEDSDHIEAMVEALELEAEDGVEGEDETSNDAEAIAIERVNDLGELIMKL
jgi:hypothetical protein